MKFKFQPVSLRFIKTVRVNDYLTNLILSDERRALQTAPFYERHVEYLAAIVALVQDSLATIVGAYRPQLHSTPGAYIFTLGCKFFLDADVFAGKVFEDSPPDNMPRATFRAVGAGSQVNALAPGTADEPVEEALGHDVSGGQRFHDR